jgi:hypothetical protein
MGAQRRAHQVDALARQDCCLAVERQAVAVLGRQRLGQQDLGQRAAGDGPCRRGRPVHALLAAPAPVAGADVGADAQSRWRHVELFGSILADPAHRHRAARAALLRVI